MGRYLLGTENRCEIEHWYSRGLKYVEGQPKVLGTEMREGVLTVFIHAQAS